ncbi:MAG: proline/glycine betaine ABC transporter substrate-binding protein ProX, partial [Mesorhizobium sp.]
MKIECGMLAIAMMAGCAMPAMADQVKPAWSGATEELFQTFIVDEGLKELGYDVGELTQISSVQLVHTAVANGDLTFYPVHWVPLHDTFWKASGGDEKLMSVGTLIKN